MRIKLRTCLVFMFSSFMFINGCSCGNEGDIRESDGKLSNMKDGILMVTKKRVMKKPKTMSELKKFVEYDSVSETGYGSVYLEEFVGVNNTNTIGGSGKDIAFYYDFSFNAKESGIWVFEFGVDAGIASGCVIDGKDLWFEAGDIWTLGDYSKVFKKDFKLSKGWHRVKIYGLENCCDGVWRLRYKSPSMKDLKIVSIQNLGVICPFKI